MMATDCEMAAVQAEAVDSGAVAQHVMPYLQPPQATGTPQQSGSEFCCHSHADSPLAIASAIVRPGRIPKPFSAQQLSCAVKGCWGCSYASCLWGGVHPPWTPRPVVQCCQDLPLHWNVIAGTVNWIERAAGLG